MDLVAKIAEDFKKAMKEKDKDRLSALRMVRSAFQVKEKEGQGELTEEIALAVLKTLAKQRADAAEQFEQGGRPEMAARERAELELIKSYLPAEVDPETMARVVKEVVAELGASSMKDMGPVMKESLSRLGAGADGKVVSGLVRQTLGQGS